MAKWASPCTICNGSSEAKCLICGWKKVKKKSFKPKLTPQEDLHQTGFRNEIEFREKLLMGVWTFRMKSIQSKDKDGKPIERSQVGMKIDQSILAHLQWVNEQVIEPFKNGDSIKTIADRTGLTNKMITELLQNGYRRELHPVELVGEITDES